MEIKAWGVSTSQKFIADRFIELGAYVNRVAHTVGEDGKYPSNVYDMVKRKITLLYDYLEWNIDDADYIQDERTTLIRALDNLPPAQFQGLVITIVNYWTSVKIVY